MENAVRQPAFADLDDAGRRRLWIVQLVLERCNAQNPADALELAFRFDCFINRGIAARHERWEAAERPRRPLPPAEPPAQNAPAREPVDSTPSQIQTRGRIPLLRSDVREEFAAMAATGVDNQALAERFRLSVRQAHAIRLSLARQRPEVRLIRAPAKSSGAISGLSREEELRLQERFLREKAPAPCTVEDVVRFLRQRGDSVISRDGRYLVNERLLLTTDQLVVRANRRRREAGAPEFRVNAAPMPQGEAAFIRAPNGERRADGAEAAEL